MKTPTVTPLPLETFTYLIGYNGFIPQYTTIVVPAIPRNVCPDDCSLTPHILHVIMEKTIKDN